MLLLLRNRVRKSDNVTECKTMGCYDGCCDRTMLSAGNVDQETNRGGALGSRPFWDPVDFLTKAGNGLGRNYQINQENIPY